MNKNIIYCIGDSHSSFFAGEDCLQPIWPFFARNNLPMFRIFHLGPILAHSLRRRSKNHGKERLFAVLKSDILKHSKVMLVFGEIDCRAHILKQVEFQKRSAASVVAECVENYI